MSKRNLIIGAIAVVAVLYAGLTATVVEEGKEAELTGEVVFDPTTNAQNFWKENSPKYFVDNAKDLAELFTEAGGDLTTVASKYGHYSMGDSGELSFIVKGSGTIKNVKNKLRSGYLEITPDGLDSNASFRIQIGPVFKNSAVRDTISLISYRDYKNQIEWAQVSVAFHDLILKEVITPLNIDAAMQGKRVEYVGCYTVTRPSQVLITPITIKIE